SLSASVSEGSRSGTVRYTVPARATQNTIGVSYSVSDVDIIGGEFAGLAVGSKTSSLAVWLTRPLAVGDGFASSLSIELHGSKTSTDISDLVLVSSTSVVPLVSVATERARDDRTLSTHHTL